MPRIPCLTWEYGPKTREILAAGEKAAPENEENEENETMRDCPLCQINAKQDATMEEIDRAIAEFKEGHWRGGG